MTAFKGKAIYQPAGKAAEYAEWACNFYVGCSNGCTYCYLKRGRGAKILGGDKPTLKKCFKDEDHALEVFEKELKANLSELQEKGLFFSFTTDPMLQETVMLTKQAITLCKFYKIPVKMLTKTVWWVNEAILGANKYGQNKLIAFGFTLTGHDELEPGASTNAERIEAMRKLHEAGFKTFASIEPIIDFTSSFEMIKQAAHFCDMFKIGLQSGKKYDTEEVSAFVSAVSYSLMLIRIVVYFKDSLLKAANIDRSELPTNCVTRDYNIFNQ